MHPRVSLNQVPFLNRSNAEFLRFCREAGVGRAVVAAARLEGDRLAQARSTVDAGGPQVAAAFMVFCRDLSQAGEKEAAALQAAISAAAAVGARSLYMLTGGRGALTWEQAADRFSELMLPCRAAAAEHGIALLIENASALYVDIHIAHSLSDTFALAERAGIGVCVELFHCWAEAGIESLLRQAAPLAGLVQVSDYLPGDRALPARAVPGDGAIPLDRMIGTLLDAGYAGVFDIELVGPRIEAEGVEPACRRATEQVSAMLARLGA